MLFHRQFGVGPPLHFAQSSLFRCQIFKRNKMVSHTKHCSLSSPSLVLPSGNMKTDRGRSRFPSSIRAFRGSSKSNTKIPPAPRIRGRPISRIEEENAGKLARHSAVVLRTAVLSEPPAVVERSWRGPARRVGTVLSQLAPGGTSRISKLGRGKPVTQKARPGKARDGLKVRLGSRRFASS
jgi:hypothetical protein